MDYDTLYKIFISWHTILFIIGCAGIYIVGKLHYNQLSWFRDYVTLNVTNISSLKESDEVHIPVRVKVFNSDVTPYATVEIKQVNEHINTYIVYKENILLVGKLYYLRVKFIGRVSEEVAKVQLIDNESVKFDININDKF